MRSVRRDVIRRKVSATSVSVPSECKPRLFKFTIAFTMTFIGDVRVTRFGCVCTAVSCTHVCVCAHTSVIFMTQNRTKRFSGETTGARARTSSHPSVLAFTSNSDDCDDDDDRSRSSRGWDHLKRCCASVLCVATK